MSTGSYDVTSQVQIVKLMEALPTGETAFLDTDIISFLDIELRSTILPVHQRVNEEFFVKTMDYSFSATSSATNIHIPQTIGMRLRDVLFATAPGTNPNQAGFTNIPRLNPEDISAQGFDYSSASLNMTLNQSLMGFFIQNNTLEFYPPTLLQNQTIRLKYFAQPATLCATSLAGQIISISGDLITLNNAPTGWGVGTAVDFIYSTPPYDYVADTRVTTAPYQSSTPLTNQILTSVSGTTYGVPTGVGALLAVGEWVAPTGYAPVFQYIPVESYNLLAQATAIRCLRALNDREAEQMAIEKYKDMLENYLFLIEPRVQGKPKKFNNINSVLQSSRFTSMRPLN
jgi:hypothetical protein